MIDYFSIETNSSSTIHSLNRTFGVDNIWISIIFIVGHTLQTGNPSPCSNTHMQQRLVYPEQTFIVYCIIIVRLRLYTMYVFINASILYELLQWLINMVVLKW